MYYYISLFMCAHCVGVQVKYPTLITPLLSSRWYICSTLYWKIYVQQVVHGEICYTCLVQPSWDRPKKRNLFSLVQSMVVVHANIHPLACDNYPQPNRKKPNFVCSHDYICGDLYPKNRIYGSSFLHYVDIYKSMDG
jgi:hypothetical protein